MFSSLTGQPIFSKSSAALHPGEREAGVAAHAAHTAHTAHGYRGHGGYSRRDARWMGRSRRVRCLWHGSVGRDADDTTCVPWVHVNVHIHAHIHVHVYVVGTCKSRRHRTGRIVHAVVAVGIDVRRERVVRVSGSARQHATTRLVRAIENLIYSKADGFVLLVRLVHLFDPRVLHRRGSFCCTQLGRLRCLIPKTSTQHDLFPKVQNVFLTNKYSSLNCSEPMQFYIAAIWCTKTVKNRNHIDSFTINSALSNTFLHWVHFASFSVPWWYLKKSNSTVERAPRSLLNPEVMSCQVVANKPDAFLEWCRTSERRTAQTWAHHCYLKWSVNCPIRAY